MHRNMRENLRSWWIMRRSWNFGSAISAACVPAAQKAFEEIRRKHRNDPRFHQTVEHYIHESERLLQEVSRSDRSGTVALNYLTSDTGKAYTMHRTQSADSINSAPGLAPSLISFNLPRAPYKGASRGAQRSIPYCCLSPSNVRCEYRLDSCVCVLGTEWLSISNILLLFETAFSTFDSSRCFSTVKAILPSNRSSN